MNETITYEQIGSLLALAAARDQRTVGDADVMAWYDDLNTAGVTYAGAREALAAFYVEQASVRPEHRYRITTPDVIRLARKLRAERLARFVYEPVDPDESVDEFQARLRAQLTAVADGRIQPPPRPALEGEPAPAVAKALRDLLRDVPDDDEADEPDDRPKPFSGVMKVACPLPDCRARVGQRCKRPNGKPRQSAHQARADVAQGKHYDPDAVRAEEQRRRAAADTLARQRTAF